MKEEAIRPKDLVERQQQYIEADIEFLQKRRQQFVFTSCPACEKSNNLIEFEKKSFVYSECSNCGMLFMNPRPSVKLLSEFYSQSPNYKFFNEYIFPATRETRREKIFIPRVKKVIDICKRFSIKGESILEIGAGFGIFCEEVAKTEYFKAVIGVEASGALHSTCTKKGFKVYEGVLESLTIEEKFDFIVAFEVFEHIFDPLAFLRIINGLLLPGGMVMLTFPNYNSFEIGMLREHSVAIDHEHLNYFTEHSIKIIMNRAGFSIEEVQTPGLLDVDLVKTAYQKKLIKNSFLTQLFSDGKEDICENFQVFLSTNRLSSHMMVLGRKL
jgi:2-polyprenyl-3-methyl-5-hydroxy-6-metoxy-1,4-benzoquinol methylase